MMSKERELLKQAIEMIKIVPMMASIGNVPPDFASELILEIQELLEQPEQTEQEDIRDVWQDGYEAGLRLAKREPLSAQTIAELWWNTYVVGKADSVRNFARAIEKAHGIGGE